MTTDVRFETPENVLVSYRLAGLGTRFVAWFADYALLTLTGFLIFFGLIFAGIVIGTALFDIGDDEPDAALYAIGLAFAIWGLGTLLYFGFCEILMNGQTIGKRMLGIRVVKTDGFSLDAGSIGIRTLFRVVDHIPLLWVVPLVSAQSQRFGDMLGRTIVVVDSPGQLTGLRETLLAKPVADHKFRFDLATLKRLGERDVEAIERLLERWDKLPPDDQERFLTQFVQPLSAKLNVEPPALVDRRLFLEELLAAEYRRQTRHLG